MISNFVRQGVLATGLIQSLYLIAGAAAPQVEASGDAAINGNPSVVQRTYPEHNLVLENSQAKDRRKEYKNPRYARLVDDAIIWLKAHQAEDGSWDADGFGSLCPKEDPCGAAGEPGQEVATTAMAVLALLGAGSDYASGHHQQASALGVRWLFAAQNQETGMIGLKGTAPNLRAHTLASLALIETYARSDSALLGRRSILAINAILSARNQQGTWSTDAWHDDSDLTGLVLLTLRAALEVDLLNGHESVLDKGLAELLIQVNTNTKIAKPAGPKNASPALTALALFCQVRTQAGGTSGATAATKLCDDLFGQAPPAWLPEEPSVQRDQDMYVWHYRAQAMFQVGGKSWKAWDRQLRDALGNSQVESGHSKGSWNPFGSGAIRGGRVYATALMILTAQSGSPHDPLQPSVKPSGGLFPLSAVKPENRPKIVD